MWAVGDEPTVADLLVVGAPTHAHGLPTTMSRKAIVAAVEEAESKGTPLDYNPTSGMRAFLDRLPKVKAERAACFDTRFDMARLLTGSAAMTMARKLRHLGYEIVVEPESFFVDDTEGPLKEGAEAGRAVGRRAPVLGGGSPEPDRDVVPWLPGSRAPW